MLRTKFALGLFESKYYLYPKLYMLIISLPVDPYPYPDYNATLRTSQTRSLLHDMERETIVLLENRKNTLPLSKSIGSLAVIGPQADRVSVSLII